MNRRLLGIIMVAVLLILSASGIYMYFNPFEKNIASLHTFFALLFIVAILFHIINNKLPLSNYIQGKRQSNIRKLQGPFIFIVIFLMAVGLFFNTPVLSGLYAFGNELRNKKIGKTEEIQDFQIIDLEQAKGDYQISVELKKGKTFQYPLFAIWAEDTNGNYIETLYISNAISSSTFKYGKQVEKKWEPSTLRRPEALPFWSHKRGIKAADGLYIPLHDSPDLDAVSGATPTGNFIIKTKSSFEDLEYYRILVEINQSFDWNEFYSEDKFPDDEIYSGTGKVGQPSLVYAAEINESEITSPVHKVLKLIGHGHHSGKNGILYNDLSKITTAKNIAERIILTLE